MFSKSLIQFSVDRRGCVLSLLLDLRPNYAGGNETVRDLIFWASRTQQMVTTAMKLKDACSLEEKL